MFHVLCHLHPRPLQPLGLVSEPHILVFIHFLPVSQLEMVVRAAWVSVYVLFAQLSCLLSDIYDNLDLVSFFLLFKHWDALSGLKWWHHEDTQYCSGKCGKMFHFSSHSPSGTDGNNTAWQQAKNNIPRACYHTVIICIFPFKDVHILKFKIT